MVSWDFKMKKRLINFLMILALAGIFQSCSSKKAKDFSYAKGGNIRFRNSGISLKFDKNIREGPCIFWRNRCSTIVALWFAPNDQG